DLLLWYTRFNELAPIRLAEVEVEPDAPVAMSRGASIQKEQRVLFPHRIGLLNFLEQFAGVGELRLKLGPQIISHGIAAFLDAGADCGVDVLRPRSELVKHGSYALGRDALHRSSPAGMERAHNPVLFVSQQYGQAVGSEDGNRDSRNIGHQPIASQYGATMRAQNVNDI